MKEDPYGMLARIYDVVAGPSVNFARKTGLQLSPPRENISILDIGCGTGTQLALYRRAGCKLYGVDTSPAMLSVARRKLGDDCVLCLEDASNMTFYGQMFDLVTMVFVLHEIPALLRPAVLAECERVVKPEGCVILIDFDFGPYPFPLGYAWRCVRRMLEVMGGRQHHANYRDFKKRGGIEPLIAGTKFSVEKVVLKSGVVAVYLLKP